jgi:ABC-type sugar transport system ATPase subunit
MIEVKNLSVKRGKFSLKNLSLTINKGESLALIGPSGAGKTLFLETILGLRKPSNGSVFINGKDVLQMKPENSSIAYLPQDLALFPHLSVYDNIAFCLKIKSKTAEYIDTVVSRLASQLRIDYLLSRKSVSNLSGGEKQRVALARALAANPELVFLDEPFSALDGARRS